MNLILEFRQTYGPVLFHPKPLATADEVSSKTQKVVDPRPLRSSSMVGIMLDIQTNKSLGDPVNDSHGVAGFSGNPKVLHVEKETNVTHSTSIPSECSELLTTSNNLEDFTLDLALERGVELVPETNG